MEKQMNENKVKYAVSVNYNNELLVKKRRKFDVMCGIIMLFAAVFAGAMVVFMLKTSSNPSTAAGILFGGLAVLCLVLAVFFFVKKENREKNNNSTLDFYFAEYTFVLQKSDGKHGMENCQYEKSFSKQYISKIVETEDYFYFVVLTGSVNFVPQYSRQYLPKNVLKKEEVEELSAFLKSKLGNRYHKK